VAEIVLAKCLMTNEMLDEVLRPEVLIRPQNILTTHPHKAE
jgi:hypothetical protein